MAIMSSRSIGSWFSVASSQAKGNFIDQITFNSLYVLSFIIISRRHMKWAVILKQNFWICILLLYLGVSVFWSDFPASSFKRWMKMVGIFITAIAVLSETNPYHALERILRRCAYILLPLSLCLIKWFPEYGIMFTNAGARWAMGVTRHKNSLGLICALFSFTIIWSIVCRWKNGQLRTAKIPLLADIIALGFGLYLLSGGGGAAKGYSATSITLFSLCITLLAFSYLFKNQITTMINHLRIVSVLAVVLFVFFSSVVMPKVTALLGREPDLTGRDLIWEAAIDVASRNPLFGTGYGGYWGLHEWEFSFNYKVNQAHNGYINVYMEAGLIGIFFLCIFLLSFCGKIRNEYFCLPEWGIYGICIFAAMLLYNYSEASFISESSLWTLAVYLYVIYSAPCRSTDEFQYA